ncbi:hypothetical protein KEM48_010920 [Puccinia striiformis f. sp. tritici PST-130]|nr:hypothetical protein KEM48_010920 [Puccinia striiformis f. sp. tritici PST-130]
MSRVELLSSGGLRLDNRRPYELRSINFDILPNPPVGCDSVARVEHGLTKLIGFVSGPRDSVESNRTVPTSLGNPMEIQPHQIKIKIIIMVRSLYISQPHLSVQSIEKK